MNTRSSRRASESRKEAKKPTSPSTSNPQPRCNPQQLIRIKSPWALANLIGLALNFCLFGGTLVLYNRILDATPSCSSPINGLGLAPQRGLKEEITSRHRPSSFEKRQDKNIHIIFSTGCGPKQNWQSYVLFHSIMESKQIGYVTRIASGCLDTEKVDLQKIHQTQIEPMGMRPGSSNSRFRLHLTPEYGYPPDAQQRTQKNRFYYMNKPYGVTHWMEEVFGYRADKPSSIFHDDTIIILLDPDMVIMRPIVNDFSQNEVWREPLIHPNTFQVKHGAPFSNDYLYGTHWFDKVKDITQVLPANELPSPVQSMTRQQLEYFAAGPPYLATAKDFYKLVTKWKQLAWPVQKQFPGEIKAEMYGYSWAAAHLNLPHQMSYSLFHSMHREPGWELLDRHITSSQMCRGNIPTNDKPHILHYCERYLVGKYVMGKHRLPLTFVGQANVTQVCESPLLAEPPTDLATKYDYYIDPNDGKKYPLVAAANGKYTRQQHVDRTTFLLCELIAALNRAATYFKQQHCGGKANYEKSMIFHESLAATPEELNNVGKEVE